MQDSTLPTVDLYDSPITVRGLLTDCFELAKIRLTAMVVITTGVGFILGSQGRIIWIALFSTAMGTWLLAASAASINQILEIEPDSRMNRTKNRPLPSRRMSVSGAWIFAVITAIGGTAILLLMINPLTAALGAGNLAIYAFIYTPMKLRSSLNTLIGAVCGAIPPVMGFTAANNQISTPALILGSVLFIWQIPHFLSLAWLYRDEYRRAGFKMLPIVDLTGKLTCRMIVAYSVVLIPITLAVSMLGISGSGYAWVAGVLGLVMFYLSLNMLRNPTKQNARRIFLASVIYLPLLLVAMVAFH